MRKGMRKGVEVFKTMIYTTFFILFALYLISLFLYVGVKEKGDVQSALNSEMANRVSNAVNLIQTYNKGAIKITLPGKYIIKASERKGIHYIEVAYKTEKNSANSKGFKLSKDLKIVTGQGGRVSKKENPADEVCIAKLDKVIHIFNPKNPEYTIPNKIDKEKCAIKE